MNLHYHCTGQGKPILLLHGLFGNLDNLAVIGRGLSSYQIIAIDLRNHGHSPWSENMDYDHLSSDIIYLINQLNLPAVTIIGHSMGGKVAMKIADRSPTIVKQLFILDIAPIAYPITQHDTIMTALSHTIGNNITDRQTIIEKLRHRVSMPVIQFLLKSFKNGHWLFNLESLWNNYPTLANWQPITPCHIPATFIKGNKSTYIKEEDHAEIIKQFPQAHIYGIDDAGHNVHAEKPADVLKIIQAELI